MSGRSSSACAYRDMASRLSRPPNGYDERLKAIESILQQLVQNQEETSQARLSSGPRSMGTAAQDSPSEEFTLLDDGEVQVHNMTDDTVDGLAAVNNGQVDARFFGKLLSN